MSQKIMCLFLAVAAALLLGGCMGETVEVGPDEVARQYGPNGGQEEVKSGVTFRLPYRGWFDLPHYAVVIRAADTAVVERMEIITPQDNLRLVFDVRATLTIPREAERINVAFDRLSPSNGNGSVRYIEFDDVYRTYAQEQLRTISRSVVSRYSIAQVLANREAISQELEDALQKAMAGMPIGVLSAGLADISPPQVLLAAQEAAKEREVAIQRAEAQRAVELTEAETRLEVAKRQQEIEVLEAQTQAEVNRQLAAGITDAWITQRLILVMEAMAKSDNRIIFMPTDALQDPAFNFGLINNALRDINLLSNEISRQTREHTAPAGGGQ